MTAPRAINTKETTSSAVGSDDNYGMTTEKRQKAGASTAAYALSLARRRRAQSESNKTSNQGHKETVSGVASKPYIAPRQKGSSETATKPYIAPRQKESTAAVNLREGMAKRSAAMVREAKQKALAKAKAKAK